MTRPISVSPVKRALSAFGALLLAATMLPAAVLASETDSTRYLVVFKGGYALDGSYALGKGYALVAQDQTYALDGTYALTREYALYALGRTNALLREYALDSEFENYALFGQYALDSGYALARNYALGSGYALARATAGYALDSSYALIDQTAGNYLGNGYALLDAYALDENYALARDYALSVVSLAGGTITADLSRQIGVMIIDSKNETFAETMRSYALVAGVAEDLSWQQFPTFNEAVASGQLQLVSPSSVSTSVPDELSTLQWDMTQIRTGRAHARTMGSPNVKVGVLDTGIDANHIDFSRNGRANVDCVNGADFTFDGPGVGIPAACVDNHFHGTHVAGTIAARANGHGIVGVAPNVTLVPIKVCGDPEGYCYFSNVVEGITYSGDIALDVINMSFFVDDDTFHESTEFKCGSDPTQAAFRAAVQRAINYARKQGVTPIAAAGNSDENLANPPGGKDCKVVPSMSDGVTGVGALGPDSEKSSYSNWGKGWLDVSAPGGNGAVSHGAAYCTNQIISTLPGNLWGCFQGTSMAAPHAAGVAALISTRAGNPTRSGGWYAHPDTISTRLERTAVDIGGRGDDRCFGMGRIDAFRAVTNTTTRVYDASAPMCPEYGE